MIDHILQAFMYPFLFLSLYFQVLLLLSFLENKKKIEKEETLELTTFPTVSVAVPCWNEERTIEKTLDSLCALNYPHDKLSIIVVDDGSKDDTYRVVSDYIQRHKDTNITIFKKENGGKHTAVNLALRHATGEFFGCLDADSFVGRDTLRTIIAYFMHHKGVMAVTPCIHVAPPTTVIQRMQAIEYLLGVFLRKAFGQLDAIQVTPGPFSIFRREVFSTIGEYRKAHNTEDFEITLRMHKAHMKIMNSHKALVYTVGPSTAKGFFYQRLRWARGFLENSLDYRELFFKKEYGNFGMFTLPMAFLFVFYGLYASFYGIYSIAVVMFRVLERWRTVGIHPQIPEFDMFYFNTTIIAFIGMVLLTLFLFALYIANILSDDKQEFYRNFPIFFILYPLFVPLFLARAVFDTFTKRSNTWVLQDTKIT
jgi:cellulose synthase/poly-beta-1,6-N-acetylglucosamine synthase-like glycosyltransferase